MKTMYLVSAPSYDSPNWIAELVAAQHVKTTRQYRVTRKHGSPYLFLDIPVTDENRNKVYVRTESAIKEHPTYLYAEKSAADNFRDRMKHIAFLNSIDYTALDLQSLNQMVGSVYRSLAVKPVRTSRLVKTSNI